MNHKSSRKHGLPTAAVGRSSQATPDRRRGQACTERCQQKSIACDAELPTPALRAGVDNSDDFKLKLMPDS